VPGGLAVQLDFTATPRHTKGQLFSWTVFDYPLKQAIIDNIVKRPLKGIAKGITEQKSEIASTRYQAYLAAGVERWKEYRDQLAPLNRKPVLFIMMNDTAEADDVGDWMQKKCIRLANTRWAARSLGGWLHGVGQRAARGTVRAKAMGGLRAGRRWCGRRPPAVGTSGGGLGSWARRWRRSCT
jgi:hypothetical protein